MQPDKRYNNTDDAVMRLDQSILKYKDAYWYCRISNGMAYLYDLAQVTVMEQGGINVKEAYRVDFNDEDLDIRSVTIGYINTDAGAFYITRPPFRKQKQGTSTVNCYIAGVGTMAFNQVSSQVLFSAHTKNALMNKYPMLKTAWKTVMGSNELSSMAFSRDFAIKKVGHEVLVYFEQQLIGFMQSSNVIEIYPHCQDSVLTMKLVHMGVQVK